MATRIERCGNPGCRKLYIIEQFSSAFGLHSQIGVIRCPYCGLTTTGDTRKSFRTSVLPPNLEDWYLPFK